MLEAEANERRQSINEEWVLLEAEFFVAFCSSCFAPTSKPVARLRRAYFAVLKASLASGQVGVLDSPCCV